MFLDGSGQAVPCTAATPLPVSASVTASISGFAPASVGTPISVTTGGVTGTLPAGTVVVASNAGATNTAYCALGASSTTAQQPIPPGGWFAFTVGVATQLTCITSTSTTTVNMVGGSGIPTGSGGGSGGGGSGGGAVTAISGAFVSGAIADLALAQNSTTAGEVGNLPLTATTTSAPTYTTAKSNPLSTDTGGNLRTVLNAETSKVIGEVNQGTSPWVISGSITGTFWQTTQPVSLASAQVASGAFASGSVASGAYASGAFASGAISDGAEVTLGAKADAASTATDTTPVTVMQVLKEISAKEQAPASRAVTGTFYQTTQPASLASAQVASGAFAAGSLATGAGVDGWDLGVQTTTAAAGCGSGTGVNPCLKQIDADIKGAIPTQAPTVSIGGVGIIDSAGTNVATVKAASTLPVAADKTLVVGLNPGTATAGSPTGAIVTVQGVTSGQAIPVSGTVTAQVSTGNSAATPHICGSTAHATLAAADTQIVNVSGTTSIYVCDYDISFSGTVNVYLEQATSGTCATLTQLTQTWFGVANAGRAGSNAFYRGLHTAASSQLCLHGSTTSVPRCHSLTPNRLAVVWRGLGASTVDGRWLSCPRGILHPDFRPNRRNL